MPATPASRMPAEPTEIEVRSTTGPAHELHPLPDQQRPQPGAIGSAVRAGTAGAVTADFATTPSGRVGSGRGPVPAGERARSSWAATACGSRRSTTTSPRSSMLSGSRDLGWRGGRRGLRPDLESDRRLSLRHLPSDGYQPAALQLLPLVRRTRVDRGRPWRSSVVGREQRRGRPRGTLRRSSRAGCARSTDSEPVGLDAVEHLVGGAPVVAADLHPQQPVAGDLDSTRSTMTPLPDSRCR